MHPLAIRLRDATGAPAEVGFTVTPVGAANVAVEASTDPDGWATSAPDLRLAADLEHRLEVVDAAGLAGGELYFSYGDPDGRWGCTVALELAGDPPAATVGPLQEGCGADE